MAQDGKSAPSPRPDSKPVSTQEPGKRSSPLRTWGFRLAALLVAPGLLLLAEVTARLAGVGHPTSFFISRTVQGRHVLSENPDFGLRFFPKELARVPSPLVLPASKERVPEGSEGPQVRRIFLFGESAALGDPEPAFGMGRYLRVLLEDRFPGVRFEVVPAAMTAINSHVLLPIARECAGHEGDQWVVYMGNNEFVGPFGAGTVLGPKVPPLAWIRVNLALQRLHLVQWLTSVTRSSPTNGQPAAWGGMKMFLEAQIAPSDPRKEKVYQAFERNLADILRAGQRAKLPMVVCTVASNLKDCGPFASTHSDLGTAEDAQLRIDEATGKAAAASGNWAAARNSFASAVRRAPDRADLYYQLGQAELALTNSPAAQDAFTRARDLDSLSFRADSRINEIIRSTTARFPARLVDTVEVTRQASPQGVPGSNLFHDHVHLNFQGNYLIARAIAEQVEAAMPPTRLGKTADWDSFEKASERLALTDWDLRRVVDNMGRRLSEPPFTTQLNHAEEMDRLRGELRAIRSRRTAESASRAKARYQAALDRDPGDFLIRGNLAKFLEDTEAWSEAHAAWAMVRDQLPWEPAPYFYLGKVAAKEKHLDEALALLDQALTIRPDLADAWLEQGRLWLEKKDYARARAAGENALRYQPNNGRILMGLAEVETASGNPEAAFNRLKAAVERQPTLWEARYLLGVQYVSRNQIEVAREQFAAVVQIHPEYALGHFNLAVALAKLGQIPAAREEFEATLKLDPRNQKAQEYLRSLRKP